MGKRELLIICAFVVVGAIAYQIAAPPPKPGERSFSLRQIFSNVKREISANAASAKLTKAGTMAIGAAVSEVRVSTFRSVPLTVIGEDRKDIAFELPVESTGPDEATARDWANKSEVRRDDLGTAVAISVFFPEEGTQNGTLTLRVPARFAVRVENSGRIQVSQVGAVELRNPAGEVTVSSVTGAVTGSHRSGELQISGAGSVNLTLSQSRATIRNVAQGITLNIRGGECSIAETGGPINAGVSNADLTINGSKQPIKVGGDGGQIKVLDAHDLSIDARRMVVQVETSLASTGQLTLVTTDEPLRLALGGEPSVEIDARTTSGGAIRAGDVNLEPVKDGRDSQLSANIGKGGARIVLRNSRSDIVIGRRK